MQLLPVMKTEKTKIRLNRMRKTVLFKSVKWIQNFLIFNFFLSNARNKTETIFLCFLKEVDRIMQILQSVFIAPFYGKSEEITKV